MKKNNIVPQLPENELILSDNGLKNLAGWLARYYKLNILYEDEISPEVQSLCKNGSLGKYEQCLQTYTNSLISFAGSYEDYEKYEFAVRVKVASISNYTNEGDIYLHLVFKLDKCKLIITINADSPEKEDIIWKIALPIITKLKLFELDGSELSWYEADEIIIGILKYNNAEYIIVPPSE